MIFGRRQPSATTSITSTARPGLDLIEGGPSMTTVSSQIYTCTSTSTVSSHINADDSSFEALPIAVGVVIFILLSILVIVIVILYKRGRFEGLFAKNRRRDNRPSETPFNGSHSHGSKEVPSENNSHLGDIDLPTDQTYNTANLKGATGVSDPTYNHILHYKNNILKTDATYNHIGDVLTFNIIGNQSDTYIGRDDSSETEYGSNDTYAHMILTGNDGNGLSPEGAYSQVRLP